jgi:hypothetical protein
MLGHVFSNKLHTCHVYVLILLAFRRHVSSIKTVILQGESKSRVTVSNRHGVQQGSIPLKSDLEAFKEFIVGVRPISRLRR